MGKITQKEFLRDGRVEKKKGGERRKKRWRDPDSGQDDGVTTNKNLRRGEDGEGEMGRENETDEMKEGSQA